MARKSKDTTNEIVNAEEIVAVADQTEEIVDAEESSELPATAQSLVDGAFAEADADDTGDEDEDSEDTGDEDSDDDESNIVLMQRSEARKIMAKLETSRKDVQSKYDMIDGILADAAEYMPAEKFAELRNKNLLKHNLTGDIDADALTASGYTADQIAQADATLRDPIEDFMREIDAINADPFVRNALQTIENAFDRASALVGAHNLRSRVGKFIVYIDNRTGNRQSDEFASKIDVRITGGSKSGSGRSRKATVRGGNVLPGLDVIGKSDGYDFHLVSQGGNGRSKDGWRLLVKDGNNIVKEYESTTLALAKNERGNNPTLNAVVNEAVQELTNNPNVKRSAPQVFAGHRIYDTQPVNVAA